MSRRLKAITNWMKDTEPLVTDPPDEGGMKRTNKCRLALTTCDDYIDMLESSLNALCTAYENVLNRTKEEDDKFEQYVDTVHDTMMMLQERKDKFKHIIHNLTTVVLQQEDQDYKEQEYTYREESRTNLLSLSKLPPIPIPTFSGKRWEWDNFWALFKANVHDQDLTDLHKLNYLLSSLTGEAKQSILRFQITAANYTKAVQQLKKRYGQKDGIVQDLHKLLKACTATGPRTEDQRQLFEKLSAIATQLKDQ
ncbi:unnamed protein product, partial [Nippostrongylus brasiliensis]|uniref:Helo_like_N domain-containing protein n=1 Tax=Nippostrongylus brasiliensis TaxID=27835 RepID=A0A0N4XRH7_NIPBR